MMGFIVGALVGGAVVWFAKDKVAELIAAAVAKAQGK